MVSVKTPHGTPLRFITSITIKQQRLTLDHWACPKDSGGFKKQHNEIIKKFMAPFYGWG